MKKPLWTMDPAAKKRCLNGYVLRIFNLGAFCPLLFFTDSIFSVGKNPAIQAHSRLHDVRKWGLYLRNLLLEIKKNTDEHGMGVFSQSVDVMSVYGQTGEDLRQLVNQRNP